MLGRRLRRAPMPRRPRFAGHLPSFLRPTFAALVLTLGLTRPAHAQEAASVVRRDADGRVTVRATRAEIDVDGNLDEPIYRQIAPMTEFIQQLPDEGAPAS